MAQCLGCWKAGRLEGLLGAGKLVGWKASWVLESHLVGWRIRLVWFRFPFQTYCCWTDLLDRLIVAGQFLLDRLVVAGQILLDRLVVAGQILLDRLVVAGQFLLDRLVVAGQILLDRLVVAGQILLASY